MNLTSDIVCELQDHMGGDDAVVRAMLVSTKGSGSLDETATAGRINFLMRERHLSPFEHGGFVFFVKAPLPIVVQMERHRQASFNEESGRYRELNEEFYLPGEERPLCQVGKAGQYTFVQGDDMQRHNQRCSAVRAYKVATKEYAYQLSIGVAKEVARFSLPLGIYKSLYVTMNPRNLMHFLALRTHSEEATYPSHPQWEIQKIADKMEIAFAEHYPLTHDAWIENGRKPTYDE